MRTIETTKAKTITAAEDSTNESNESVAHILRQTSTIASETEDLVNKSSTSKLIPTTVGDKEDTTRPRTTETKTILMVTLKTASANISNDSATTLTLLRTNATLVYGTNATLVDGRNISNTSTLIPATVVPILIIGLFLLALVNKTRLSLTKVNNQ